MSSSTSIPLEIKTIKSSVKGVEWKPEFLEKLETLVLKVNKLVTHVFSFSKYIFLQELEEDINFNMVPFINHKFFVQVFLCLVASTSNSGRGIGTETSNTRIFIRRHFDNYCRDAAYKPIELANATQIALYEADKIKVAYLNSIKNHFGQQFRKVINLLFDLKNKKNAMHADLKRQGFSDKEIKDTIYQKLVIPAANLKKKLSTGNLSDIDPIYQEVLDSIKSVFDSYPINYKFSSNSIYYDSKAKPENHINAYYKLARISQYKFSKCFQCFPLRTTWIPCYMQIDTFILCRCIMMKDPTKYSNKVDAWAEAINIKNKVFKPKNGKHGKLNFQGTIQTDGVGISVILQNKDPKDRFKKGETYNPIQASNSSDEFPYIHNIDTTELKNCTLIDPGRRDIMFCLNESSTKEKPNVFRYTSNQRHIDNKDKKYRNIRQKIKSSNIGVQASENLLSTCLSKSVQFTDFIKYLAARAVVSQYLDPFYTKYKNKHPTRQNYLFRKLKLASYIRNQQGNEKLAKRIRKKFGSDTTLVFGNWSAANVKFQEPIPGIGLKRMLQKKRI